MLNVIKELEKHKLDPAKLTLETLTTLLPSYFKSQKSTAVYQWACIPCRTGWSVNVYLYRDGRNTIHRAFTYPKLDEAICYMLLWLLDNDIISYHQIIELL